MHVSSCTLFLPLAFPVGLDISCHCFDPHQASVSFPVPLPQPDLRQAKGPKAALMEELGLWCICWKQWFLTMAVRGKERLHLPPPSCCFRKRALPGRCLGRWWLLAPASLPLPPSLNSPTSFPPPCSSPYLLPSLSRFLSPPLSLLLLPLPPSPSTSRQCKPLAEELEGHPRKYRKKRHLDEFQNTISLQFFIVLFLY